MSATAGVAQFIASGMVGSRLPTSGHVIHVGNDTSVNVRDVSDPLTRHERRVRKKKSFFCSEKKKKKSQVGYILHFLVFVGLIIWSLIIIYLNFYLIS